MKKKIETPKVFISYAWGDEEHNNEIIAFATDLKSDGVDVVLDRWQLKEGFDTYSFMEKSVTDPTITNVLILLDPIYSQKADSRSGGVGTETQIISPEVYNKVEQDKILPVVFKRDENGDVCKPQYLKGRLHFDLSQEETYDTEYQRLVRRLYGIQTIREPELGKPPSWLDEEPKVKYKSKVSIQFFSNSNDEKTKRVKLDNLYDELVKLIEGFIYNSDKKRAENYEDILPLRDEFLLHLKSADYVNRGYEIIAASLERISKKSKEDYSDNNTIKRTLVHELFIYIIAYYLKHQNYDAIKYVLNKSYFAGRSNFSDELDSYNAFYCSDDGLDREICERDNKKYYSGTAQFWVEHINIDTCNKQEFVFGDLFCYNASYMIDNYEKGWHWFPITYVYAGNEYQSLIRDYSLKLKSREHLENAAAIMGFSNVDAFRKRYKDVEEGFREGKYKEYRYSSSFEEAGSFWQWTGADELGIRN